jgi:hypothetical protein
MIWGLGGWWVVFNQAQCVYMCVYVFVGVGVQITFFFGWVGVVSIRLACSSRNQEEADLFERKGGLSSIPFLPHGRQTRTKRKRIEVNIVNFRGGA